MNRQGDETMNSHKSVKSPPIIALPRLPGLRTLAMIALAVLLAGCFGGGQPGRMADQYVLDYAPVAPQETAMLPESITVEHFSAAQLYSGTAMVYQEEPYKSNQFLFHHWRVNPADLVTDCLLRDLRSAAMFRGVFSYRSAEVSRYRLAGAVEEFRESGGKEERQAVLSLNITLFDTARQELPDQLMFQKNYRIVEPLEGETPADLAKGMSRAVAKASELLLTDIYKAVRAARAGK
jgi:ABC-type uncharacterized transport system auxiliary subunit